MSYVNLQDFAKEWDLVQRSRIALGNMSKAWSRLGKPPSFNLDAWVEDLERTEAKLLVAMRKECRPKGNPEPWLDAVYRYSRTTLGLGDVVLVVVGMMPPLIDFANPAKVWRYCGLDPVNGKARKRTAGEFAGFSIRLRSYVLMRLVDPVIKCTRSPYRATYDARRVHSLIAHPEWGDNPKAPDMHYHRDAIRYTAKRILRDLWRAGHGHTYFASLGEDAGPAADPSREAPHV